MREKKIRNTAIISDDLYVRRKADEQLEHAILLMEKPAYISVARQMGKTNLLLHAKRRLGSLDLKVIFVDVTNSFLNPAGFFRYIIDEVLDNNPGDLAFQLAKSAIYEKRSALAESPPDEYIAELKQILEHYPGKVAIFLDEIDTLKRFEFSDLIFSQIRKLYFVRQIHPLLIRVSHVLCGVIEPGGTNQKPYTFSF